MSHEIFEIPMKNFFVLWIFYRIKIVQYPKNLGTTDLELFSYQLRSVYKKTPFFPWYPYLTFFKAQVDKYSQKQKD